MTISTYAELKTAVENWLARTDQSQRTPEFITLAEAEINRRLAIREMESRATAQTTQGQAYIELPAAQENFLGMRRLTITSDPVKRLLYYAPAQLEALYGSQAEGRPEAFTIIGQEIQLRPIPGGAYDLEALYLNRLSAISDSNVPTLFANNPDLYLYGALSHAIPFINEPDETARFAQFRSGFDSAIEAIIRSDRKQRWTNAPLAVRADIATP